MLPRQQHLFGESMKVTAAIFRDGDKVLLMRRAADQPLAGTWEYPGGKFEYGEDGPTCLHRELSEELGIDAQIGDLITIAKHTTDSGKVYRTAHIRNQILHRRNPTARPRRYALGVNSRPASASTITSRFNRIQNIANVAKKSKQ